jgi:DNA/RNA endonuclease YhcR with UshA esterase domain
MKNSVGWRIAMNARIGFKLQVTAKVQFHSLYNWSFQTMWLFSCTPEDPENDTVMEKHSTEALYLTVKSLMHAIWTQDEPDQQDAAHQMIQIGKRWMIRRWLEFNLANVKPHVWITKENAHLVDFEWTEADQAKLKTLVERYTSWGTLEAWRVH